MIDLKRLGFDIAADFNNFDIEQLLIEFAVESLNTIKVFKEWHESGSNDVRHKVKKENLTNHLCRLMKYVLGCAVKCNINIEKEFSAYTEEEE